MIVTMLAAFVAGIATAAMLPVLPLGPAVAGLALAGLVLGCSAVLRPAGVFLAGVALFCAAANLAGARILAESLAGEIFTVTGKVAGIVTRSGRATRFELDIERLRKGGMDLPNRGLLRLAVYDATPRPSGGERWRFTVRLKPPRATLNEHGFDYERWLFANGYVGRGYVSGPAERLAPAGRLEVQALRQGLYDTITGRLGDQPFAGLVIALVLGERSALPPAQHEALARTGTAHLVAISGLHVGLAAVFCAALARALCAIALVFGSQPRLLPAMLVAATAGAVLYALLAGMTIPTRRALVAVLTVNLLLLTGRRIGAHLVIGYAACAVLILDPLSVLLAGFWLSFGTVALLVLIFECRPRRIRLAATADALTRPAMPYLERATGRLRRAIRIQWLLCLLLVPVVGLVFGRYPPAAPLANLVCIPAMAVLTAPLCLAGALTWLAGLPGPALGLFEAAAWSIGLWWPVIDTLAALPPVNLGLRLPAAVGFALLLAAVLLLLDPLALRVRSTGLLLIAGALAWQPADRDDPGRLTVTVADVGQGLAVLVSGRRHSVLYDTGDAFDSGFSYARSVVLPLLHRRRIGRVDLLFVSHENRDHSGGARHILERFPVGRLVSRQPARHRRGIGCRSGDRWFYGDLSVEVVGTDASAPAGDNNASCVVRVAAGAGAVLLTGDIERAAEARLVRTRRQLLRSTVLVVPHHGSDSSSSQAFLDAVGARIAVVSAGYRNRFGHPRPAVVARLASGHENHLVTADEGAITIDLGGATAKVDSAFRSSADFWHRLVRGRCHPHPLIC